MAHPDKPGSKGERRYWLDEQRNVDKIYYGLLIVCAALAAADLFYEKHAHFAAENWFAFYGVFGFVACAGLVLAAKELRKLLKRDEDYYGDN
jgi:protein-S-isoprenylcysteine O-methyltransferase Ste14